MITIKNQKKNKGKSSAFIKHELEFSKKKLITEPQKNHLEIQSPRPTNKTKKRTYKQSPTCVKCILLISSVFFFFYNPSLICPIRHQICLLLFHLIQSIRRKFENFDPNLGLSITPLRLNPI
jgi:hypothetical protein